MQYGLALITTVVYFTYIVENSVLTVSKPISNYEMKSLDSTLTENNYIIQSIIDENNQYSKNIYYPRTVSIECDKKISDILRKYEEEFKKLIEDKKNEKQYKLNINFNTINYSKDIVSFVLNINIFTDNLNPIYNVETITYDFKDEKEITLSDLYENNKNYLYELSKISYKMLKDNENIVKFGADKTLKEGTKAVKENFEKFAIGQNCVIFYFQKNKIAPYAAGNFKISIPFSDVKNIFCK